MRRRQAFALQSSAHNEHLGPSEPRDFIGGPLVIAPVDTSVKCPLCGAKMKDAHGLKVHKARMHK